MSRTQLLLRLVLKAAWVRKDRALTALISVAVVATIATAALTIYSDLEGRLSRDFRGFGANVIVTRHDGSFTAADLAGMQNVIKTKHFYFIIGDRIDVTFSDRIFKQMV